MAYYDDESEMEAKVMKLNKDVNDAFTVAMRDVQDYATFDLQRAFYRCASACFDGPRRSEEELTRCINHCRSPVAKAEAIVNREVQSFQERLTRSIMVCRDRFEAEELRRPMDDASVRRMDACVQKTVQEHIEMIPKVAAKIKQQITLKDELR